MERGELEKKIQNYLEWEEHEFFRQEIQDLLQKEQGQELEDRFWRDMDFGTGGLRGLIGGGFNRINPYIIRKATQGLALYIKERVPQKEQQVVIGFDSRHYSDLFAREAARVFAANGIKAWLFSGMRPTPELSFALREKKCCAGVMITASHNTAAYNGYKVFWSDGAQVVPPHDRGIIAQVRQVQGLVAAMDLEEAQTAGLILPMGEDVDGPYQSMAAGLCLRPDFTAAEGASLSLVYTPLHGAGGSSVEGVLGSLGFSVTTVPEQREPDGGFPTVEFPNPEMSSALKMALELAEAKDADLVMATDPDVDRLGIAVPDKNKEWVLITGNQLGALLADYIFRSLKEAGKWPSRPAFVNTIVTSELQNKIALAAGAASFRVLTGFKYIGEKIGEFEAADSYTYLFGGEESYGYLAGTAVRDKDAVSAAALTAEMALWNRSRGCSVLDHLEEIWARYGYWEELLISRDFQGEAGQALMEKLMKKLRESPPGEIAGRALAELRDYRDGSTLYLPRGKRENNIDLPSSNVLQFVLEEGSLVTARPSGTEPKIKFYASCHWDKGSDLPAARGETKKILLGVEAWIKECIDSVQEAL